MPPFKHKFYNRIEDFGTYIILRRLKFHKIYFFATNFPPKKKKAFKFYETLTENITKIFYGKST